MHPDQPYLNNRPLYLSEIPRDWPPNLQAGLSVVMHSGQPMLLSWGAEQICFFNEAFQPGPAANGGHVLQGQKGAELWQDSLQCLGELTHRVMDTGKPATLEDQRIRILRNGIIGHVFWTINATPIFGEPGETCGVLLICNDTTEKVNLLSSLEESNRIYQRLTILVENSVDLMAILGMDGKNIYINSAGKALLGVEPDADVTQIPIADFHTAEQLAFVQSEILPTVMARGKWSGTFAIRNMTTGEIIPLQNNCHRIDDERTGAPIGVGTVMRDIRNELNTQERLEHEVQERTRELIKLNEELERKNVDLASFAFVSSHDLQEPLRKITTFISRIEDTDPPLSAKQAEYFEKIKRSAVRMQTLIQDLLHFSKISINQIRDELADLDAILAETLLEYHSQIESANGSVRIAALPVVHAIPFQVRQLFDNLIGNAVKFARPEEPLVITISYDEVTSEAQNELFAGNVYHRVTISDNGIGFHDEYKEKIFGVFQRLHGREQYEGTGIGLAICKKIMENHQGYITANGVPGRGARFQLYFPVQPQT